LLVHIFPNYSFHQGRVGMAASGEAVADPQRSASQADAAQGDPPQLVYTPGAPMHDRPGRGAGHRWSAPRRFGQPAPYSAFVSLSPEHPDALTLGNRGP